MLGHHWGKCQISLVLASGVQMKEGAQRETLLPNKKPVSPSKCRFLSKFPKAHSCNSMFTSINGPCLCCFRKYLDMRRWSQASQVLSLSSSFSARPSHSPRWSSFSFSVISWGGGIEKRVRKEARSLEFASTSPGSHTTHRAGLAPNRPPAGKWLKLGPVLLRPRLPPSYRKYHPLSSHPRLPVPMGGSHCVLIALIGMIKHIQK